MLGASAGGLSAFNHFLEVMPIHSGYAFVLISHLAPEHISILPEILQKKTAMKVIQAENNLQVTPNCVYVLPENKQMTIVNNVLKLHNLSTSTGLRQPIDTFLHSLAKDKRTNATAIILSGTGSDGSKGVVAVHQAGGLVIAQSNESAKYSAMPDNAIATGHVDYVLPITEIPEQLTVHYQTYISPSAGIRLGLEDQVLAILPELFPLLEKTSNHDFSDYKTTTICRRVERRMAINHIPVAIDYLHYLQENKLEVVTLGQELLIGVTSFFRDPSSFEQLKEENLTQLLKLKSQDESLRIWVAGCSTGEEVYSIAILVQECMEALNVQFKVQIFGTDIDENAIQIARTGVYPQTIAENVTPVRLKHFFTKKTNGYQVNSRIRETVLFATQNVIVDPPFTKLDLLCCRNLLIYFTPKLQQKLFPIFHYSLNKNGLLFLGTSENLGSSSSLFCIENKKWKIFKKIPKLKHKYPLFNITNRALAMNNKAPSSQNIPEENVESLKLLKAILTQSDLPACVIVDEQEDVIYIHGRTGRYLEPPEGPSNFNIIDMARHGLKMALKKAIQQVNKNGKDFTLRGLKIHDNMQRVHLDVTVKVLPEFQTSYSNLLMVIFEEVEQTKEINKDDLSSTIINHEEFSRLQEELLYTKESLQTNIEELETSNEEMKLTNEELQSTNEELQSTNEELETSKEELQSLIEESATTTSELQNRIDELMLANDDIKNLLDATDIASVFLDIHCAVRRFTPKACEIFPLTSNDLGRPISHFASKLVDIDVEQIALNVLDDLMLKDLEVVDKEQNTLRMRVRPYRTLKNVIDGVVITFEDITMIKALEFKLQSNSNLIENDLFLMSSTFLNAPKAAIIEDLNGYILFVNNQAVYDYGWSQEELVGQHHSMLIPNDCMAQMAQAYSLCHTQIVTDEKIDTNRLLKSGKTIPVTLSLLKIEHLNGRVNAIVSYAN